MDERRIADDHLIDPDVDSAAEGSWRSGEAVVVAAVSAGGVLGAAARYEAGLWWPSPAGGFPWTTFGVNVLGSALLGVLMVLLTTVFTGHRLLRPLLGTGVLGGFTTFSTYAVDVQRLIATHRAGLALAYLAATLVAALSAVALARRADQARRYGGPAMTLLLVMLGAAAGAPMRYLTDRAVQSRYPAVFPWGTFTVNVVACLVLGAVTGAVLAGAASPDTAALIGTGFCGALSTYSTFSYENLRLIERRSTLTAVANVGASIAAGLGAAFLGAALF